MKLLFTDQDASNKLITYTLLLFFMAMYVISFVTGKKLDLQGMIGFLLPIVTHGGHLVSNFLNSRTSVAAATSKVDPALIASIRQAVVNQPPAATVTTNGGTDAKNV